MAEQQGEETKALNHIERRQGLETVARDARRRAIGSYVLGGVAAWKLLRYEAPVHIDGETHGVPWLLIVWIGLGVLAFGLASWDQLVNAMPTTRRPGR